MKLFTCGPVSMYESTALVRAKGFVHFRTPEYGELVKRNLSKISVLLGNSLENSTIYLAASGTGAMEAVVENCIQDFDKCLVINGGGFGKRFCELLEYHNKNYSSLNLKWNEILTKKHFLDFENKDFTSLIVNIHETTSGQLYDIKLISDFCKRNNLFLIVDAISSFLIDDYDMEKYGVDATIISSQKGLCCSPGMSLVSFSKRMIEKINNAKAPDTKYFDFKDYLINIQRGQTPYTPPVLVMYEIEDMLNNIEKAGGLEGWKKIIAKKAQYFRQQAVKFNLKLPDYPFSNMLTPVEFGDISAYKLFEILKDRWQIYFNPCGGELKDKLVRISHIGNTTIEDIDYLLEKLVFAIKELKGE